jgi:ApeA N-terminal domain 1
VIRLEIEGHFWLPADRDNRAAGRLVFDPVDGSQLELIGALDDERGASRIIGCAADGAYTLDECFLQRERRGLITKQVFRVGRILGGFEYEKDEETVFDQFNVGLNNLIWWIRPAHMPEQTGHGEGADGARQPYSVSLEHREPQSISIVDGELSLHQFRSVTGDSWDAGRRTSRRGWPAGEPSRSAWTSRPASWPRPGRCRSSST